MDEDMITKGTPCIDWRVSYQLGKLRQKYGELRPREFDFAYAITCHKAQGSEWDKVLVIEERFPFNRIEHARWLYTAATRASEKLVLVKA
jgi:ATP-dependent exoDNAse (exonuclease V) alpha subunit